MRIQTQALMTILQTGVRLWPRGDALAFSNYITQSIIIPVTSRCLWTPALLQET